MRVGIIILSCLGLVQGYNILCIQGLPSRSHYNLMYGIVKPLLQAGHQITLVTVFPEPKPVKNLTVIDVSHVRETIEGINVLDKSTMGIKLITAFARNASNAVISTAAVRDVLTNKQFDAVINEWFVTDADAGYAAVQQTPWILLLGTIMSPYMEHLVDTVKSIPTIPLMMNDSDIPMSLWQRINNTLMYLAHLLNMLLVDMSTIERDYINNFGPIAKARHIPLPPLQEAKHNISVLFVNSHPSFAPAQSVPPNVIDIAGYHIGEAPPLPKDLQELLDSTKQGFIYFSMGSVVKTKDFTEKTKNGLIKIFEQLPYTILWKDGPVEKLPKNVHVKPWMPQTSILAHPNIKLFITHGGLLSIIETLKYGVPVLAVPVYGDQPSNANRAVIDGYGLRVDFSEDMGDKLADAIREMTSNDSYYKRAKAVSDLFLSRPVSSSKLIQHYVELAIRSEGARHLRSKSQLYTWYELLMLDQLVIFLLFLYIVLRIVKKAWMAAMRPIDDKIKTDYFTMMIFVLLWIAFMPIAYGYHILCIQSMPMRSHYILMKGIVDILLEAGHEITMITTYPDMKPVAKLNLIDVSQVRKIIEEIDLSDHSLMRSIDVTDVSRNISRMVIESSNVRDVITNKNFDAVVSEWFYSDLEAGYAALQQVPWIVLSNSMTPYMEYLVDTVRSIPSVPVMMDEKIPINFVGRAKNTLKYLMKTYKNYLQFIRTKADYDKYFRPLATARNINLPSLSEAVHNISILFVNTYPSMEPTKSLPPNVINIAGYHFGNIPPLPKDLQEILDSSEQGVIYFSMGSALKVDVFSDKTNAELMQVFGSLPYTILWKLDDDFKPCPQNVHIRSWVPQSSVVAHPNVKLFITHGGLLSTLEAIHNGLPMIVIPVFGDQITNAARSVEKGLAIKVNLSPNIAQDIYSALNEIVQDDRYHKRAMAMSTLFKNGPIPPSKLVKHYVELAIQSKGAYHLRSPALLYKWYELWMMDQLAALLLFVFIIYLIIKTVVKKYMPKKIFSKLKIL